MIGSLVKAFGLKPWHIVAVFLLGVGVIGFVAAVDTNTAGYIKIRQLPVTGTMEVYTKPGMFFAGAGEIIEYKQAGTYTFADEEDKTAKKDSLLGPSIEVRFNDGGIARLAGNARFDLPMDKPSMLKINRKYRSYDGLANKMVKPAVAEALILTASLMSAEESYSGRRSEFSQLAWDQVLHGIYITESEVVTTKDTIEGEEKQKRMVKIKRDTDGNPLRKPNPLEEFDIVISQFFLAKDFDYEDGVLQQISNQRDAMMKTVAAKAEAEKSQQDRITAQAKGQADVMAAKYEAEVVKERAVVEARKRKEVAETEATQKLEVAKLDKLEAEQYKAAKLLRADADATYKARVFNADGALSMKLEAWLQAQKYYADAMKNYKGNWVPEVQMGGAAGESGNGAQVMIDLLSAKTAQDIALDLKVKK